MRIWAVIVLFSVFNLANAQDYRQEIEDQVITPCIQEIVRRHGETPGVSQAEMVELIRALQRDQFDEAIEALIPLVEGQPEDVRKSVYLIGLQSCIPGAG